jgi:anti-sigma factor RsiW
MSNEPDLPAAPGDSHETFEILMMGYLDGELVDTDHERFHSHLQSCARCSVEIVRYRRINDLASALRPREPQDYELERFWKVLYNRMERRGAWLLLAAGVLVLTSLLVVEVVLTPLLSSWVKLGIGALAVGFVLLFLNVLRARLRTLPYDRYREIQR